MTREWEVFAVRVATRVGRRQDFFLRYYVYGEPDAPMRLDYYFWVLRSDDEVVLVDAGIDPMLARPGRELLITPREALQELGIAESAVGAIVVSHGHSDHIGGLRLFPEARVVVQRREVEFWNGPWAAKEQLASTVDRDQIAYLTRRIEQGHGVVLDGDADVGDGVRARLVGGHTPGQQIVTVATAVGDVVLPSDAVHFYEELDQERPFSALCDLTEVYRTYELLADLRNAGAVVVPGHDPGVMERFPSCTASGHVARIA